MKAIVWTKSGSPEVLQLKDIEKPTPKDHEVLIRVNASTVTSGDVILRKLHPLMFLPMRLFGVRRKRIPGHELAGVVEDVGTSVRRFRPGDQVFGTTTGLSTGANAEYVCLPEAWTAGVLAVKPANLTYEESAAIPVGGMTALYILRRGNIQRGQSILVYGASGSVGTFAVQLARYHFGANVTGICSTANIELVKSLGADQVIDYTKEDFTRNGATYDVVFDAVRKLSASDSKGLLKENSSYLSVRSSTIEETENLLTLKDLAEAGKVRPVIDRRYSLEEVPEAYRYVETGHKKGNVVITVA
jgi:NADPH:quinone reductase-like Zn-dependent oxidoreductase